MIKRLIFLLAILVLPVVGALGESDFEKIVIDTADGEGMAFHKIDHDTFLVGYRNTVNDNFKIMRTTDSFDTVDLVYEAASTAGTAAAGTFVANNTHIFYLYNDGSGGNDLVYVTSDDDGETWSSPTATGTSAERAKSVEWLGDDEFVLYRDFAVMKTNDNFASFYSKSFSTSIAGWAAQINETEYLVITAASVGTDRVQWETCTDTGSSFSCSGNTVITDSGTGHVHDIHILSETDWAVVGNNGAGNDMNGAWLVTSNSGSSWTKRTYDGNTDLREFIIPQTLHAFNDTYWHIYNRGRNSDAEAYWLIGFNGQFTGISEGRELLYDDPADGGTSYRDGYGAITDNNHGLLILMTDHSTTEVFVYREATGPAPAPTTGRLFDDDSFIFGGNKTDMASDIKVTEAGLEALYGAITIIIFLAIGASAAGGFGAMGGGILGTLIASGLNWLPPWAGFFMAAVCMAVFSIVRRGGGD